ncbi:hypothetical protein D9M71_309880 [compost metagenome]
MANPLHRERQRVDALIHVASDAGHAVANRALEADQLGHLGEMPLGRLGIQVASGQLRHVVDRTVQGALQATAGAQHHDHHRQADQGQDDGFEGDAQARAAHQRHGQFEAVVDQQEHRGEHEQPHSRPQGVRPQALQPAARPTADQATAVEAQMLAAPLADAPVGQSSRIDLGSRRLRAHRGIADHASLLDGRRDVGQHPVMIAALAPVHHQAVPGMALLDGFP